MPQPVPFSFHHQGGLESLDNLNVIHAPALYFVWIHSHLEECGCHSRGESHFEAVQRNRKSLTQSLYISFFARPAAEKSCCSVRLTQRPQEVDFARRKETLGDLFRRNFRIDDLNVYSESQAARYSEKGNLIGV